MDFKHIAIIGIGLIGSSLALSLKKAGFSGKISGIGRRQENLVRARELGIIDSFTTSHAEGVKNADLIVLASSVQHFKQIVTDIKDELKQGAIVTDVGSVKAEIVNQLEPLMPDGVSFVAGHPIAGKECSGINAASPDLFRNAKCIITPSANTDKTALKKIRDFWEFIGTGTIVMSPEEHDSIFAAVSHLPHIAAYALINAINDVNEDMLQLSGKGLKDMTRTALSPPSLWRDICSHNRKDIILSLKSFSSVISRIMQLIEESDWDGLEEEFKRASEARQLIESD